MSFEKVLWGRQSVKYCVLIVAIRIALEQFYMSSFCVLLVHFSMFALFKNQCISAFMSMLMGVVPGAQFYSFQLLYIFEF